jgi:hypothetical protein
MFCAIYDCMEVLSHPAQAVPPELTPEIKAQLLDHYLLVSHWRYRWYLDVLATVKDTPKDTWPAPPWYVIYHVPGMGFEKLSSSGMSQ